MKNRGCKKKTKKISRTLFNHFWFGNCFPLVLYELHHYFWDKKKWKHFRSRDSFFTRLPKMADFLFQRQSELSNSSAKGQCQRPSLFPGQRCKAEVKGRGLVTPKWADSQILHTDLWNDLGFDGEPFHLGLHFTPLILEIELVSLSYISFSSRLVEWRGLKRLWK